MIWKNPFLSKNSEQQISGDVFLALFDCTALEMIDQQNLEKVTFISSTPGAGKSSLFRAFSPNILNRVMQRERQDDYKELYNQMQRLGVFSNNEIALVSTTILCANGYSIIDEMFQNGRRKQVLFALLNYRIAISLLRGIGQLLDIAVGEFDRIEFNNIPTEMSSEIEYFKNGSTVYEWACNGERKLCQYLDSERIDNFDISFVHTTLLTIKLFEPSNILVDKVSRFDHVLIIFDDFHKLSASQRDCVTEAAYTMKSNVGIWFGQRLEGLNNEQIVSMDGTLSRDYNPNIIIDNYWPSKKTSFYKMLESIANRRVGEAKISGYTKLSDCVAEALNEKKAKGEILKFCDIQLEKCKNNAEFQKKYANIIEFLNKSDGLDIKEKAIWYECIVIKENRIQSKQLSIRGFFEEKESLDDFKEFVEKNHDDAWFYVCMHCKLPFYYGLSHLKVLASYNIEQFLDFSAGYFESCRIKAIGNSGKHTKSLSAQEQQDILNHLLSKKWNDMDYRYQNIDLIKTFLNNIAKRCEESRDAECASYGGGAYTGFAVSKEELKTQKNEPQYKQLVEVIGECLASKYLERRELEKEGVIVFYLNRWLCAYYHLPLAYGGWFRCNMNRALKMCEKEDTPNYDHNIEGQMELLSEGHYGIVG